MPAATTSEGYRTNDGNWLCAERRTLVVGSHSWNVTGLMGAALYLGADGMYFVIAATPDSWHFGAMRAWHFFWAWLLVLAWSCYILYVIASGRLRRFLLPSASQCTVRSLGRDLWNHLRLHRPTGDAARDYNILQKIAYLAVLFVLIPVAIGTGLTMSNAVTTRFPELYDVFGGRQSARTIHALCAASLVLFVVIHVVQTFVGGFVNEFRSMVTGVFHIRRAEKK